MSFSDKVVLVTGASSGIGAATAVLFASAGARVALVARNEAKLGHVAQQCAARGAQPLVTKADIANEQEANTVVKKTVDHFGKLDILVNNAGILRYSPVTDPSILKVFDEVMNTNLRSVVQLTNRAAPHLVSTKGNVVNVSSVASQMVAKDLSMYCVSKAGMDHFTRCAALELASSGVRVNSVNPGPVKTDIAENAGMTVTEEMSNQVAAMTALGRGGDPEEIADVIAFLASEKARSITGSIYTSDNGYLLKN